MIIEWNYLAFDFKKGRRCKQKYASDDTKETISSMSETSLDNSKEPKECIVNTNILKQQITECRVVEILGYSHGKLAIGNPEKHIEYLEELISRVFKWRVRKKMKVIEFMFLTAIFKHQK